MGSRLIYLFLFAVLTVGCNLVQPQGTATVQASQTLIKDMVFGPGEFSTDNGTGMTFLPSGMSPDAQVGTGTYLSDPIKAPFSFNAVVPQWQAGLPVGSELSLELRTGNDPGDLGTWIHLEPTLDWTLPEDKDTVGDMLVVPGGDRKHGYVQYRISLSSADAQEKPLLRELKLTFIDSTAGPSVEEMIRQQEILNSQASEEQALTADGFPKPFVISRKIWCTDPNCNYSEGLTYHPVSQLILHHTVSSTGEGGDSAAVVRAIWQFHTTTRGWRDIGYNYLVDTKGVLYEGHLGGDDVVGIHASGANTGSMALAMIGTYSTTEPPNAMFDSAADLFAWKADQKKIDVFDANDSLPGISWGLPNLMGHRDVYGTTECPGGTAHLLLPKLREEISSRIGFESPHVYVDELSQSFRKSNANWYDGPYQCGFNAHAWYTYSTTDPAQAVNWGEWRPDITESGLYRVEVYAPYCNTNRRETGGAHYRIEHADGSSSVFVDQDERIGLWTTIGDFRFLAGGNNVIRLDDLTTTDSWLSVWFDAIRLQQLEISPSVTAEKPEDSYWSTQREVAFSWQIDQPDLVQSTVLQVATDSNFQNRIANEIWSSPVLNATLKFEQDYGDLYWRVAITSAPNKEQYSQVRRLGIDSQAPVSLVTRLYWLKQDAVYKVFWEGQDALIGIESYNIDIRRADGDPDSWERWLSNTSATSAIFIPPEPNAIYEFRSQAVDKLGNTEPLASTPDLSTEDAKILEYFLLLPLI